MTRPTLLGILNITEDSFSDGGRHLDPTEAIAAARRLAAAGAEIIDIGADIEGFSHPELYPDLAAAECRLIVMHAVQGRGRAQRVAVAPGAIWKRIIDFFAARIAVLEAAGIARARLILDPGMGFFLSSDAAASLRVLAGIEQLKQEFGLPVLVSVSRKSFLAAITGRDAPDARGAASLAAELYAAANGADYIRTHDPGALSDGLAVMAALAAEQSRSG
jgi:dihydropteroate synthase type 2